MRSGVEGLVSPRPLGRELPGLYQDDELAQRLTGALDEVLAPVFWALESFDAYLDPELAPPDFLDWLAGWVGIALDENWPLERQRELVGRAGRLYSRRGTVRAVIELVELYVGVAPEVIESGGVTWSVEPGSELPGEPVSRLLVRLPSGTDVDVRRLESLLADARPAHVPFQLEVVAG
ncbi:MAG: phage tail protein [Acidimicrobiia bacterium]